LYRLQPAGTGGGGESFGPPKTARSGAGFFQRNVCDHSAIGVWRMIGRRPRVKNPGAHFLPGTHETSARTDRLHFCERFCARVLW